MNWLTYGVPAGAIVFGVASFAAAWFMSARFHRKHPRMGLKLSPEAHTIRPLGDWPSEIESSVRVTGSTEGGTTFITEVRRNPFKKAS